MHFTFITTLVSLLATSSASSVCGYYGKTCGDPCNYYVSGATPLYCSSSPSCPFSPPTSYPFTRLTLLLSSKTCKLTSTPLTQATPNKAPPSATPSTVPAS